MILQVLAGSRPVFHQLLLRARGRNAASRTESEPSKEHPSSPAAPHTFLSPPNGHLRSTRTARHSHHSSLVLASNLKSNACLEARDELCCSHLYPTRGICLAQGQVQDSRSQELCADQGFQTPRAYACVLSVSCCFYSHF